MSSLCWSRVFEKNWQELLEALENIASQQPSSGAVKRPPEDILEEILEIVRGQERQIAAIDNRAILRDLYKEASTRELADLAFGSSKANAKANAKNELAAALSRGILSKEFARHNARLSLTTPPSTRSLKMKPLRNSFVRFRGLRPRSTSRWCRGRRLACASNNDVLLSHHARTTRNGLLTGSVFCRMGHS